MLMSRVKDKLMNKNVKRENANLEEHLECSLKKDFDTHCRMSKTFLILIAYKKFIIYPFKTNYSNFLKLIIAFEIKRKDIIYGCV